MASTPNKKRATSSDKGDQSARSPKAPKQSKPRSSMGLNLLLIAIGTSLIGLGGLGYFFYQELISSSKREVDRSAEAQTRQIENKLANMRLSVDGAASAARALSQQQPKPKSVDPYQKLIVEGLQKSELIAGMGIAQNENMLFLTAKPLVSYVWREQSGLKLEISGQKVAATNDNASNSANNNFLSANRLDILNSPFYKAAIAKGKATWTEPYNSLGKSIITYSAPISDGQKTLGVVNADAIASNLLPLGSVSVDPSSETKIGFVVVSASGKVIASDQFQTSQTQNPAIAEALNSLVQQSKAQPTGIAQAGGNLWAYRKIEGSDWLVVASLPEAVITNKLIVLVGGAALGISAILAIAILGFINSLKIRLKPLTEECDRFLAQQGNSGSDNAKNIGKDEIEHLSLALKSTLQQVKANATRLRSEPKTPSEEASAQVHQSFVETELIEAEVGDLLDVVSSMEEGDLTIEAQVNDRATGLVADTLNRLREKLVEIISSVLGTAQQVAQGASDLEELARTVVLNTAEQAQSVAQGQALTEQVAMIASRSAAQVNVANQSLQEVRDTVASGQTAINTLTESISVLQTGSAQIVQRMKTLGEFVGLAEQFVQDQGQIASLTQVLALNATLVAARAAEQKDPKQFAGVAREFEAIAGQVNDLATQTNDGLTVLQQRTSQIQTVVTAIDVEVQNLSGLVSGFTTGVESSQSAFNSIQVATEEVVQIGQTITESSTEIAEAADSTADYISEISKLADRTADLTRSARQQAEAMGNQAQQLLQGIRFFRLPDVTVPVATAPQAVETASTEKTEEIAPSTSINSLLDSSTKPNQADADPTNSSLGLVVPAIAVATFAVSQSGQDTLPAAAPVSDIHDSDIYNSDIYDLDDDLDNDEYPLDELDDLDETVHNKFVAGTEEIAEIDSYLDLQPEPDQYQSQYFDSELTDISAIERSLLADLVQEVYDDSAFGYTDEPPSEDEDDLSVDIELTSQPTLKDPMAGVDEFAIIEASGDPMIVSATSSFLEDTAFGTASTLSEDTLANLPTSIDFTIPDLDDDDFGLPNTTIESTLDDSNPFFDANPVSQFNAQESEMDFDPFYIEQSVTESSDYLIEDDNIFDITNDATNSTTTLGEDIPEIAFGTTSENIPTNVFEDYSDYISDEALNESIEESLDNLSNEAYSDTFDISFDESPFDRVLGEALTNSLDESLEEDFPEEYELEESLLLDTSDLINETAIAPIIAPRIETSEPSISDQQPETAFPSMFDESEEDLDDESDDFTWQSEAIASNLSDLADIEEEMSQTDISDLNLSLNSGLNSEPSLDFELPDFEEMIESDDMLLDALLDEAIDFDISDDDIADDFDALQNSLDTEELSAISVDRLLIDADISSLFNTIDQPEFEAELGIEESLDIYEESTLDADEFVGEVEFDIDVNNLSEPFASTFASGSYISEDGFEENIFENTFEEASIFDPYDLDSNLDNDLNSEFLANPLESAPDLSLDFSNDWLEGTATDADKDIQNNIENMEELSLDTSGDADYEFPDNLLDSLMDESDMDESDEKFAGLPMNFSDDFSDDFSHISTDSDFTSISDLVLVNPESDDSESGFDFSAFDQLIDELDELPDNSVTTARAEIDDFLSGSLEEIVEERPKSEKNKISDPLNNDTRK